MISAVCRMGPCADACRVLNNIITNTFLFDRNRVKGHKRAKNDNITLMGWV